MEGEDITYLAKVSELRGATWTVLDSRTLASSGEATFTFRPEQDSVELSITRISAGSGGALFNLDYAIEIFLDKSTG